MHEDGWCFTHVSFPGFYHFEKCEPKKVSYRLDYNQEGIRNKREYVQMFSDCGWEYIEDFMGYSYFRKEGQTGDENPEIFCDDASRLDMMYRVFRGRIIPLIIIFALVIILLLIGTGTFFWLSNRSVYEVKQKENGYVIEAEHLNSDVVKEYALKKGDTISFGFDCETGYIHLDVSPKGKDSVFFGDFYEIYGNSEPHIITIQEDGIYTIEIDGRNIKGEIEVIISK